MVAARGRCDVSRYKVRGEVVVVTLYPFTVTQLVQCKMPHACVIPFEIFF